MEKLSHDNDLIERYLEGSLNEKESKAFDERTMTDATFLLAFLKRKLLQESYIKATKHLKSKNQIRLIVADEKRKTANRKKAWLVAASFIILAGIGSFIYYESKQPTSNGNLTKQDIKPQKDEIVSGKENKIAEYGSLDSLDKQNSNSVVAFLPPEGTVFNQNDTIWFSQKNATAFDFLTITDKSGLVIKKVTVQSGRSEYQVLPFALKPGTYSWYFSQEKGERHSFKIK